MITVVYDGNLGNNLFQYAFGRLLAERYSMQLCAEPIEGFPATLDAVEGHRYEGEQLVLRGQKPALELLETAREQPVLLTGYFQRAEYYVEHREKIRRWFAMDFECGAEPLPEEMVVGIRRGRDYIPVHGLPLSYYESAIEGVEFSQLHICSDSPDDPFVKHLAKRFGATIRQPGALDNLQFISRFKKMVISNSSFLWWGAFLSDADPIVYPRPKNGFWSEEEPLSINIDLELKDDRYRYLACEPYRSEFFLEAARIQYDRCIGLIKDVLRPLLWFRNKKTPQSPPYRFREE